MEGSGDALPADALQECPICLSEYGQADLCITLCNHSFCTSCLERTLRTYLVSTSGSCPMCREPVSLYSVVAAATGEPLRKPRYSGIASSIYVQHGGGVGIASYHFAESVDASYICYTAAPAEWMLDDGRRPPEHKPFLDASYDAATRTYRGSVAWPAPGTFHGDARWEYEMIFDHGFGFIAAGQLRSYDADGSLRSTEAFPAVLQYYRHHAPPTSIVGQSYMQLGRLGLASYHFEECDEASFDRAYISYAAAPEAWRLDGDGVEGGGGLPPAHKPFEATSYDRTTRTFRGTVHWLPPGTFHGNARWEYEMVFAEDFGGIEGGSVRAHCAAPDFPPSTATAAAPRLRPRLI